MYQLYAERSPNVFKVALFLEEAALDWNPVWTDVSAGAQFSPDFVALSPNGRIPLLIDETPADGGPPLPTWESGAILLYLAEKTGRFLPQGFRERGTALQWLFWQMAGLGPMSGQNAHFIQYEDLIAGADYAAHRYHRENGRLLGVLNRQLEQHEFIAGDYSIADMACFPWVRNHEFLRQDVSAMPALTRWLGAISERPATKRAYARIDGLPASAITREERFRIMCGDGQGT